MSATSAWEVMGSHKQLLTSGSPTCTCMGNAVISTVVSRGHITHVTLHTTPSHLTVCNIGNLGMSLGQARLSVCNIENMGMSLGQARSTVYNIENPRRIHDQWHCTLNCLDGTNGHVLIVFKLSTLTPLGM